MNVKEEVTASFNPFLFTCTCSNVATDHCTVLASDSDKSELWLCKCVGTDVFGFHQGCLTHADNKLEFSSHKGNV